MPWTVDHHTGVGIVADALTFLGAALLTRDAFLRLRDLQARRTNDAFRERFPGLNLTDKERNRAIVSMGWTLAGFTLLMAGFLCQLVLRWVEK